MKRTDPGRPVSNAGASRNVLIFIIALSAALLIAGGRDLYYKRQASSPPSGNTIFGENDPTTFAGILKRAQNGSVTAQGYLGSMYYSGINGAPKDLEKAFGWFEKAARQGDDLSQCFLGIMYSEGESVPADRQKAYAYFKIAVDGGNETAKTLIGKLSQKMNKDELAEALKLSGKLADEIKKNMASAGASKRK